MDRADEGGSIAAQAGWEAVLDGFARSLPGPLTVLDEDSPADGPPSSLVAAVVHPDEGDERWRAMAEAARRRVRDGGLLVLRTGGRSDDERLPPGRRESWTSRFQDLMRDGFTVHGSGDGSASFRRAPTTVLYLAPWVVFGGSDKGTVDWLRHMPRDSFRCHLVTTQPSENPLFAAAESLTDEAWSLPDLMPGSAMPQFIVNFVASRNVDVVHIMNSRLAFDLLPTLKGAFPFLRTVVQLHVEEEDRSGYCRFVTTRYGNLVDAFSVTSEDLRSKLRRYDVSPSKTHVIYTGLDVTEEFDPDRPPPAPPPLRTRRGRGLDILFPARLTAQKDPLLMVRVAAALRDAGSDSVIHVVGDGELRGEVEAAVAAARLQDRVVLHGSSYDMAAWYRATDVTLLTSTFEGMPFVIFEALGMARPVVVPDLGGSRELVDDEVGFLVRRRDSVDEYVAALLRLERDPQLRAAQGKAGRRRIVEGYTVGHMASAHADLYRRLAAQHAVAGLLA